MSKKTILILGGGFGGLSAAGYLSKRLPSDSQVILIDRHNYQNFYPALYEIAAAHLEEKNGPAFYTFEDLRQGVGLAFARMSWGNKIAIKQGEIGEINLPARYAALQDASRFNFDYLIVALGSETNFFNIPHLAERSLGLKTLDDALNVRNAIDELFYRKKPNEEIHIVIGGGGFTGCELAGELSYFLKKLSKIHPRKLAACHLTLLEGQDSLLAAAADWLKQAVQKRLEKLGVKIFLGEQIMEVGQNFLLTKSGQRYNFDLLIWTAGVRANNLIEQIAGAPLNKGCLTVNQYLQVGLYDNVFAIGDNAFCFDENMQQSAPALAQVAIEQGEIAAKNILNLMAGKSLISYALKKPFFVIPLGGKYALAEIGPLRLRGGLAWIVKYLSYWRYFLKVFSPFKATRLFLRDLRIFAHND